VQPAWVVDKRAALACMREKCLFYSHNKPVLRYSNCTNMAASDVPAHVAQFVRANNRFYYANNPYLKP
jgi:hypothetical protein